MRNTIIIIVLSLLIFSCTKDNSTSAPILKFESVNTTVLQQNQMIQFTLSFTDTNGDLNSLFTHETSQTCTAFNDSTTLPAFTTFKKQSGQIVVTYFNSTTQLPFLADTCAPGINDTCYFRFVVKDMSGQLSDTVQSPTIVVIQ